MLKTIKRHLHPLGGHILFWNIALFVFVKFILPHSTFPLASILDQGLLFTSRDVIALTNQVRTENNLPTLNTNFQLDNAAYEKLNDMVENNYFAHVSPSGITPWFWMRQASYPYTTAGENLAIGFFTAEDTMEAWLKSPSHRANILNSKYEDVGIAVGRGKINNHNGIVVVQMFGKSSITVAQNNVPTTTQIPQTPLATIEVFEEPQVAAAEVEEIKVELNQPLSTDEGIGTVREPLAFNNERGEEISNLVSSTNFAFTIYAFALAIISVMAFFLFNSSKGMAIKSLIHVNVFLLTIVISASEVYIRSSIF